MLKQSVFRNLSPNDFEDSSLMFHAKTKTKFTGYPDK